MLDTDNMKISPGLISDPWRVYITCPKDKRIVSKEETMNRLLRIPTLFAIILGYKKTSAND
jgi:hypothetical protein